MSYTLSQLAEFLGADIHGDGSTVITSIATVDNARSGDVTFVYNKKYLDSLKSTSASAVIIRAEMLKDTPVDALVVEKPRVAYAKIVSLFYPQQKKSAGIHPSAYVDKNAKISEFASIGANVVIEEGVLIAEGATIEAGCVIGSNSTIGKNTHLHPNVTVYYGCHIGENCILHSASVVGSDGFGFELDNTNWLKIPQVGGVRIGNDVELGACSVVDRGAMNDTVIEDGVKLDNHVQIAHNTHIGAHTIMSRGVGVAGSTKIGKHCMIGGMAGIRDNIEITDNVIISAMTLVTKSLKEPGSYASAPPVDNTRSWRKNSVRYKQLDDMAKRIRLLEKQIEDKG